MGNFFNFGKTILRLFTQNKLYSTNIKFNNPMKRNLYFFLYKDVKSLVVIITKLVMVVAVMLSCTGRSSYPMFPGEKEVKKEITAGRCTFEGCSCYGFSSTVGGIVTAKYTLSEDRCRTCLHPYGLHISPYKFEEAKNFSVKEVRGGKCSDGCSCTSYYSNGCYSGGMQLQPGQCHICLHHYRDHNR